uniref:Resistance to inhibitors of cholinesterase homolog 3 n=1 Tax=Schistocephalus solidus TaxID=70667 RepID=A0A0X3P1N2_SCHSO
MLGHSPEQPTYVHDDRPNMGRPPVHPRAADLKHEAPTQRKGGILSVILPIYALGIFIYFAYILYKLFGNKNQTVPSRKEKYLKDYYRNFRYNVDKEKFMMDSDSSDEDNSLLRDGLCGKTRRSHSRGITFQFYLLVLYYL